VTTTPAPERRRYDSPLRRERAAQTRTRIVAAGAELLRGSSIRDWRAVTIRAVAQHAGVNERTVYRHFANERALRDAVMQRLEEAAGVDLSQMRLHDIADVTARVLHFASSYPMEPRPPLDPTLAATNRRQHDALLAAVAQEAPRWQPADRALAAATLDTLWAVGSYERLVSEWGLDRDQAIRGLTWVIQLVEEAIREDRRPPARTGSDDATETRARRITTGRGRVRRPDSC
jgi:AcrR family transcriptional regulator